MAKADNNRIRGSNARGLAQNKNKDTASPTPAPTRRATSQPTAKPVTASPSRAPTRSPTVQPTQFPTSTPPPGVRLLGHLSLQFSLWSPPLVDLYSPTTVASLNDATTSLEASQIVQKLEHEEIVSIVLETFLCLETPLAMVPLQAFESLDGNDNSEAESAELTPWEQALSQDVCQVYQTNNENGIRPVRVRGGISRARRILSNSAFTLQDDVAVLGQTPTTVVMATLAAPSDTDEDVAETVAFTHWKLKYSVWGQDEDGGKDQSSGSSLEVALLELEGLIQLELNSRIRGGYLDQDLYTQYGTTHNVDVMGDYSLNRNTTIWASIPGQEYATFYPRVSELNAAQEALNAKPTPFLSDDNLLFYIGVIVLVLNSIFVGTMLHLGARHRRSRLRDEQIKTRIKGGLVTMEGLDYVLDAKHIQYWADVHASPASKADPDPPGAPAGQTSSNSSQDEFFDVAVDDKSVEPKVDDEHRERIVTKNRMIGQPKRMLDDRADNDDGDDESVDGLYAIPTQYSKSAPLSKK